MGRLTHKARYEAGYKANKDVRRWECIDKLGQLEDLEDQKIEMIKDDDGHYVPLECCTMTNPATSGGSIQIDDIELPCGLECGSDCNECVIQRIMDKYGELVQKLN